MPPYAELHCLTHFTFLRGASRPAELVQRAQQLGYSALAITEVEAIEISFEALDKVYESVPPYMKAFITAMAERDRKSVV